ncbi:MAG: hypothetical protein Q8S73_12910 [Deltaproteobacteria bacterium]|nr:hypothetical protein [Myxococcales bacterium]MDP3215001.1 hypothetical protein [Deltaproteobacteria bacterium]
MNRPPPEDHDPAVLQAVLSRPLTADAAVGVAFRNNRHLRASLRDVGGARVTLPIFDQRRGATAAYGA